MKSASPAVNVCNGKKGDPAEFPATLPSGKTETGAWSLTVSTTTVITPFATTTFNIPLEEDGLEGSGWAFNQAQTEEEKYGKKGGVACVVEVGEPLCIDTGCEGTVAEPSAPPGELCIYTGYESTEKAASNEYEARSFEGEFGAYSSNGAIIAGPFLEGSGAEPGKVEAYGSWAVTAP